MPVEPGGRPVGRDRDAGIERGIALDQLVQLYVALVVLRVRRLPVGEDRAAAALASTHAAKPATRNTIRIIVGSPWFDGA